MAQQNALVVVAVAGLGEPGSGRKERRRLRGDRIDRACLSVSTLFDRAVITVNDVGLNSNAPLFDLYRAR
jgi:hypothetical protein